ncbi:hypothetical protein V491_09219 [Pseudogymnoascus sp. VKM F-3775]|nr:hypothetical protein V491_09219 [Pseudogymnoascus sp. VKM F-3775]
MTGLTEPAVAEASQAVTEAEASKAVTGPVEARKAATSPVEVSKAVTGAAEVNKSVTKATAKKSDELSLFWRPQEIVYVIVGPEAQKFAIHKDQLCTNSAYFKAALEGGFQEAVRREVILDETNALAFGMMLEWLYTGKITEKLCSATGFSNADKLYKDKPTFRQLLDVWVLGDYLMAPKLQNFIVDMMEAKHMKRGIPPVKDFTYFYEHTQSGSPMRKFLVDMCIWRYHEKALSYQADVAFMPRDMAGDIMVNLALRAEGRISGPSFVVKKYHVPVPVEA